MSSLAPALIVALALGAADDATSDLVGTPVVVLVRADTPKGRVRVGRPVRRGLADALGGLASSRALEDALKADGAARYRARRIAAAARAIGAMYVADVKVTYLRGLRYQTKVRLIDAATGTVKLTARDRFGSRAPTATRHGDAIAERLLAELRELRAAEPRRSSAAAAATPEPEPPREPAAAPLEPAAAPPVAAREPEPELAAPPPPAPAPPVASRWVSADDPAPVTRAAPKPAARDDAAAEVRASVPTPRAPPSDLVRLSLALGSGLVRDYALSAARLGASSLSHAVQPVAWVALDAELRLPSAPVSFFARGALRPVGYAIDANDLEPVEPRGMLIDTAFGARYHLRIAGPASRPVELVPTVAVRYASSNVDFHPGNIIPNTETWVLGAGVGLLAPLTNDLELWLRGQLGPVLAYDEAPLTTGLFAGGWSTEVGFGARFWLTEAFALTFDSRFTYDALSFEQGPSRFVPRTERGLLEDAALSISDLRAGAGCTVRL